MPHTGVTKVSEGRWRIEKTGEFQQTLKGLGSGTLELLEDFDGDTYRTVYTVRFKEAVYVLHAFKKKSKRGIATPKSDIDLIKRRLKDAESDYTARFSKERKS